MSEVWLLAHEVLCAMRKRVNLRHLRLAGGGVAWASAVEEVLEPLETDASGQPQGAVMWLRIVHPMYPEGGNT